MVAAAPRPLLPYLGLSVQRIESRSKRGGKVVGLEIVSVDPNGPAERAGLKGRGGMTRLGASGATAGALMAPLDVALLPLLKKTGQLGQTGDLIVAIDDRRVTDEVDLETALDDSKPGDTIYLTVLRLGTDGTHQTLKIPVKLGNPVSAP
jgi:S1-C subfamily serine protease